MCSDEVVAPPIYLACFLLPWLCRRTRTLGSKDVYEQVNAGPYKLFVTIRMPNVIPGVATIEVRSSGAAVQLHPQSLHPAHRRGFKTSAQLGRDEALR